MTLELVSTDCTVVLEVDANILLFLAHFTIPSFPNIVFEEALARLGYRLLILKHFSSKLELCTAALLIAAFDFAFFKSLSRSQ